MAGKFIRGDKRINRNGRPVGSSNRDVERLRNRLKEFLHDKIGELPSIWDELSDHNQRQAAKEKINMIEKILKYTMPSPLHELEQLSEAQLDELIHKLKNGHNSN